ncbi:hypothetical protein DPSP01_011512 [Paraphaeosphaeria sporulosa]|uniref:Sensor histidine kinase-like protein/response regulator n=1 Tax=Paraphaeosphaeria sporulosa TaxID=1460663 RepID=A0A177CR93_9PLEO|nr:uncharacterized protein CC84DRAFT_433275 [Paraphaeosphaeria sporulosa]OAG09289.1 hypothetical protein CC84DRAFT_433275 [Paraphaeosphaeria sporulosa]
MTRTPPKPPVAVRKRERDVHLLYGSAFRDLPKIEAPDQHHTPRASADSTLIALAQLAATRLQAARACVTLIDENHQHFLAEATPTLPLRPKPEDAAAALWLGNVSVPRSWGVCEEVLEMRTDAALVINDLLQDQRYAQKSFVQEGPRWRFYAGVPLISPRNTVVGVLSLWNHEPRSEPGLSNIDVTLLQDFAATITKYLDTYTLRDQYQRGEQFTRGLLSFAQGASALKPFKVFSDDGSNRSGSAGSAGTGSAHSAQVSSLGSRTIQASTSNERSIGTLQNSILPLHSKDMFSRAANVMMASSNLDGVLILDASVAATGHRQFPGSNEEEAGSGESSNSASSSSDTGSTVSSRHEMHEEKSPKKCSVLGYALRGRSNNDGTEFGTLLERDLARLLKEWSTGKITNFTATGASVSSTDDTSSNASAGEEGALDPKKKGGRRFRSSAAVHALLPNARSVAFVPFWDYERSRWFAGCLCWSNSPQRLLSSTVDLNYFKIFSDSIMRELSRLDALASHQQKTTFVASISHELRSPLHGILGTLEFIKDTKLDSFQISMLNSLHSCGQTLLDTINQVMDYAKSNEAGKTVSSRRLKNSNTIRLSSKPLKTRKIKQPSFDLRLATEEVVEAVFSGSLYIPVLDPNESVTTPPTEPEFNPVLNEELPTSSNRKQCYIVLDLAQDDDWVRCFPVGAWKRIVMNLFGNAIKYTESGHIQVSLRSSESKDSDKGEATSTITLTIKDSGAGMSPSFLANKAFQPFSQENSHSSGVGLGLSIVRQIIETSGGKMEVSSEPSVGTTFIVKLSLTKPTDPPPPLPKITEYLPAVARLAGRRVCILHRKHHSPSETSDSFGNSVGLGRFTDALKNTLETHFKMQVVQTEDWSGHEADIVICPEPSFEYLDTIRRWRVNNERAPVTVFVAMDALEAATFRSDVRVDNKESVVEIMTQPCGPYKLAYILGRCLDRFDDISENIPSNTNSQEQVSFPQPKSLEPPLLRHGSPEQFVESPPPPDFDIDNLKSRVTQIVSHVPESAPVVLKNVLPIRSKSTDPHVLVVDDNVINRRLLVTFLKKQKYSYSEAENGLTALQMYQNPNTRYDFILMDMSMPVMDGMTATRAIRQYEQAYNVSRCCVVALTGLASNSARLEAWNAGIDQYMTKPVNFKKLAEILNQETTRRASAEEAKQVT